MRAGVFTLEHEGWLHILPVCHYRAEFADLARQAVREIEPAVVGVELPASLESPVLRAVARLPELSIVVCPCASGPPLYLTVEPSDAGVEALRTASELGAAVALVDLDLEGYAEHRDPVPDSHAVGRLGLEAFYRACLGVPRSRDPLDDRREAAMAHHLQRLRRQHGDPVLLVTGIAHAEGVREQVGRPQATPFAPPRRPEAVVLNLHPACLPEVLAEAPGVAAVYELLRDGVPAPEPLPEVRAGRPVGPFRVLDGASAGAAEQRRALLVDAARRSGTPLDRQCLQVALFDLAAARWEQLCGGRLRAWQRDVFARYSRNLAALGNRLVADPYDFLLAVRGVGDENLVYEAFHLLMAYPWQREAADLPSVHATAEQLGLGARRIRIRPRFHRPKQRVFRLGSKRRKERYPGEWLDGFDEPGFCSYPPEDLVIEGYAGFLRRKGRSLISEEQARVEPFESSLLDGIDLRETLRHWATEHRIWVRELGRAPGDAGSVVVVFDEDEPRGEGERFPYRMTWLGEHDNESDMAFYCTSPAQGIQGPGISRCEYGGFLMSYPPGRLLEVWNDPDYRAARSKAEVLLLAALDYSLERLVVHVAARPPRSLFRTLAERIGRRIVHIPIGQLSPRSLERIRVFHILAGRDKRAIARDSIW